MMGLEDVVVDMDQYVDLPEEELYAQIETREARKVLLDQFRPNPSLWQKQFLDTVAKAQEGSGMTSTFRGLRILIQRQTLVAINNHFYHTSKGTKVVLDPKDIVESAKGSTYWTPNDFQQESNIENDDEMKIQENASDLVQPTEPSKIENEMDIDVLNTDCLDAAHSLLCSGYNPCVLNMANAYNPGGGWHRGAGAQEENLCRRSTLITALTNHNPSRDQVLDPERSWKYPIGALDAVYNPKVIVFRSNEQMGYDFLAEPYSIGIVTAAMVKHPSFTKQFDYTQDSKPEITNKLKAVLRTAFINGHDSVVLSAWGCGAFRNPPVGQAKLWKELLFNDEEFKGKFKKIVFAIFDDHNTGKAHNPFGNYLPFLETFGITQNRISEFVDSMNRNESVDGGDDEEMKEEDGGDIFENLKSVFEGISESEKTRDLEYDVVSEKLGGNSAAINVLYCGGWKRTSDGSRLRLESKRIQIAGDVYQQLIQYKNSMPGVEEEQQKSKD